MNTIEKIRAEIERRIKENRVACESDFRDLLSYLDTLKLDESKGLYEAAFEYSAGSPFRNTEEAAFKAGAEWQAGLGKTKEEVIGIAACDVVIYVPENILDELDLRRGDTMVVQIRKK